MNTGTFTVGYYCTVAMYKIIKLKLNKVVNFWSFFVPPFLPKHPGAYFRISARRGVGVSMRGDYLR